MNDPILHIIQSPRSQPGPPGPRPHHAARDPRRRPAAAPDNPRPAGRRHRVRRQRGEGRDGGRAAHGARDGGGSAGGRVHDARRGHPAEARRVPRQRDADVSHARGGRAGNDSLPHDAEEPGRLRRAAPRQARVRPAGAGCPGECRRAQRDCRQRSACTGKRSRMSPPAAVLPRTFASSPRPSSMLGSCRPGHRPIWVRDPPDDVQLRSRPRLRRLRPAGFPQRRGASPVSKPDSARRGRRTSALWQRAASRACRHRRSAQGTDSLNPPKGEQTGHTIIIRDVRVADAQEAQALSRCKSEWGNLDPTTIQRFELHSSWGSDGDAQKGGAMLQVFWHDTRQQSMDVSERPAMVRRDRHDLWRPSHQRRLSPLERALT